MRRRCGVKRGEVPKTLRCDIVAEAIFEIERAADKRNCIAMTRPS